MLQVPAIQRSDGDVDLLTKGDNNQVFVLTAPLPSLTKNACLG